MRKLLCVLFFLSTNMLGQYYSQIGQDEYLNEHVFHNKKNGFFIDIGAYDGVTYSNSYFFEKDLDWRGICFEPNRLVFRELRKKRGCICINGCVAEETQTIKFIEVSGAPVMLSGIESSYDSRQLERLKLECQCDGGSYATVEVPAYELNSILRQFNIDYIDYLSLDTEGGELDILRSIDFDNVYIEAISVENNYDSLEFRDFLEKKGFSYLTTLRGQDEIYRNVNFDQKYHKGTRKVQRLDFDTGMISVQKKEWSILICTIAERKAEFEQLISKLKKQIIENGLQNKIEVLYFLDDKGDFSIGFKRNRLLQESKGLYTCFVDDDDNVHDNYINMIYEKLQLRPDCVSLVGIITQDGAPPTRFVHSIKYDNFFYRDGVYYRPPNHLNPMKREIAVQFLFPNTNWSEDASWAMQVVNAHALKTEEEVTEPYYFYLFKAGK